MSLSKPFITVLLWGLPATAALMADIQVNRFGSILEVVLKQRML